MEINNSTNKPCSLNFDVIMNDLSESFEKNLSLKEENEKYTDNNEYDQQSPNFRPESPVYDENYCEYEPKTPDYKPSTPPISNSKDNDYKDNDYNYYNPYQRYSRSRSRSRSYDIYEHPRSPSVEQPAGVDILNSFHESMEQCVKPIMIPVKKRYVSFILGRNLRNIKNIITNIKSDVISCRYIGVMNSYYNGSQILRNTKDCITYLMIELESVNVRYSEKFVDVASAIDDDIRKLEYDAYEKDTNGEWVSPKDTSTKKHYYTSKSKYESKSKYKSRCRSRSHDRNNHYTQYKNKKNNRNNQKNNYY